MFYRLFGWRMRQITSHMHEFWALRGLDIAVPSFGLLSERFRSNSAASAWPIACPEARRSV
ncbi:hypothetical protein [Burkholderia sp. GS2Y]|uniref:Uncharacterized protein n=1 Tax=Burkholderia theae TaxID=3143496 RepID=A0ABU9WMR1_9BURK